MTMSWADSVADNTTGASRPTRPSYVPPHLRKPNPAAPEFSPIPPNDSSGFDLNRSRSREFGRPNRGRWGDRRKAVREPNPFDVTEKFAEFGVTEEEEEDENNAAGGINFDAYEDIPVETSGSDVPPQVNTFAEIDLGEALNQNIKRCKYVKPTPVQRHAIPIVVAGRDLMACAQTGSGKTAAFCFPIISGILKTQMPQNVSARNGRVAYPLALILSPTRELSCQIHEEAKKFSYQTGVRVTVAYGGAPMNQQLRNLDRGVDILVATPGRLVDLIERARVSLSVIKYLALDEADRMLDMGFEPQIRKIVQQMDMPPPGQRQTMLFSATFPTEIQRLASDFLSNYIFLTVGRVGSSTDLIEQRVEFVHDMDKRSYLMDLLHTQRENGTYGKLALTLVFVETKRGADALEHWLSMNGFPATAIHGDKIQMEREHALRSFKSGATPIMVATDVAARGLDIPHVSHVINFDLPKDIDDYVHRIGRTGRAGKSGLATAFFNEGNQPMAKALLELMQEANQEVPTWLNHYAERSSYGGGGGGGRSRRHGGGRFGAHDYRRDTPSRGGANYYSSPHNGGFGGSSGGYGSGFGGAGSSSGYYAAPSHGYDYGHESIVPSGWD
ncbi:Helicase [Macleaya cordata]|uniref:RNA helicase n=1 Tax=Macleaya cordata TaxID=56857 RepID=A0A200PQJ7_MACCD|nr:Helicase [Macleaya cordata]